MSDTNTARPRDDRPVGIIEDSGRRRRQASVAAAIAAGLLVSATALPALAEDFANDPARPWPHTVLAEQRPLFGGTMAAQPGAGASGLARVTTRHEASNAAHAPTRSDAVGLSLVPSFSTDPHMYDYLSGPEYRGGQ
jgi:hypothetical protein